MIKNAGGRTVIRQIHDYCFDQEKEWMREHLRFDIDRQKRISKVFRKLEGRITSKIKKIVILLFLCIQTRVLVSHLLSTYLGLVISHFEINRYKHA